MIVTFQELKQIFKLKDKDEYAKKRTLRPALFNKIIILTEDEVEVYDEELKRIITSFREYGGYDLEELCAKYGLSKGQVGYMIRNKDIPFFQLQVTQGSKHIFLKEDIEKAKDVILMYQKSTFGLAKLQGLGMDVVRVLFKDGYIREDQYKIFCDVYVDGLSYREVAKKRGCSGENVRLTTEKVNKKILRLAVSFVNYSGEFARLKIENEELKAANAMYKAQMDRFSPEDTVADYRILIKNIEDIDVSMRLGNILRKLNITKLSDLESKKRNFYAKAQNMGEGTMRELDAVMEKYKLKYAR